MSTKAQQIFDLGLAVGDMVARGYTGTSEHQDRIVEAARLIAELTRIIHRHG